MLVRVADGAAFTSGRATFLDGEPGVQARSARIFVRVKFGEWDGELLALLDTAAEWCILNASIAREIGVLADEVDGERRSLRTARGTFNGHVIRLPIRLLADEGVSLDVECTVFISAEWEHGNFIGYQGLLERVRFAIDPASNDFLFGPLA